MGSSAFDGRRAAAWAAIFTAGAVGGCTCDEAFVGLEGLLEVRPTPVDFGKVPVGGQGEQAVTFRNVGTYPLDLEGFAVDAPFLGPTETASVGIGATVERVFAFRPTEVGAVSGVLRVTLDDPDAEVIEVPMIGEGIEAAVRVEPLLVDFGEVLYDTRTTPASRTVTVTNPGTDAFELTALDLAADAGGAFSLSPGDAVGAVGPGEQRTFEVGYVPNAMGLVQGSVRIQTTADTAPEVVVSLRATAVGPVMEVCAGPGGVERCASAGEAPAVDFGPVALGTMASGRIRVVNTGDRALTVQGQLLGAPGDIAFAPSFASLGTFTLAPAAEQVVDVTYAPQDYAFDAVNVSLGSDSAVRPSQVVPVQGEVPRPKIEVLPRSMNFRAQGSVQMTQAPVKIINCGTLDLTLTGPVTIRQTAGPTAGAFSLSGAPVPGTVIAPSPTCDQSAQGPQFMVVFEPGANGQYRAEIPIGSDDPGEAEVVVEIVGSKS